MSIARVWIEPGCIRCSACAYSAPDVFRVPSNSDAVIQGCARVDGIDSTNLTERAALMPACARAHAHTIREAVEGCPVGIIRYEESTAEVASEELAPEELAS